jgi:hypothetical protein
MICSSFWFVYSSSISMFFKSLLKNISFLFLFFLVLFSLIIFCYIQLGKTPTYILYILQQCTFVSLFRFAFVLYVEIVSSILSLLKNISFLFLFFLVLFSLIIFCYIQLEFQQTLTNNIFILLFDLFKSVKKQTIFISHFHFHFIYFICFIPILRSI